MEIYLAEKGYSQNQLLWLLFKKHELSWEYINKIKFENPSRCFLKRMAEESRDHLFVHFPYVKDIWRLIISNVYPSVSSPNSFWEVTNRLYPTHSWLPSSWPLNVKILIPIYLFWGVWKEKNDVIFRNHFFPLWSIGTNIISLLNDTTCQIKINTPTDDIIRDNWLMLRIKILSKWFIFNLVLSLEFSRNIEEKER